jgi:hypothetical protein
VGPLTYPSSGGRPVLPRHWSIYIAGRDNAANVSGYSIIPRHGRQQVRLKLDWDAMHNGDSFIDAT